MNKEQLINHFNLINNKPETTDEYIRMLYNDDDCSIYDFLNLAYTHDNHLLVSELIKHPLCIYLDFNSLIVTVCRLRKPNVLKYLLYHPRSDIKKLTSNNRYNNSLLENISNINNNECFHILLNCSEYIKYTSISSIYCSLIYSIENEDIDMFNLLIKLPRLTNDKIKYHNHNRCLIQHFPLSIRDNKAILSQEMVLAMLNTKKLIEPLRIDEIQSVLIKYKLDVVSHITSLPTVYEKMNKLNEMVDTIANYYYVVNELILENKSLCYDILSIINGYLNHPVRKKNIFIQ
jgi:hypothetical protein